MAIEPHGMHGDAWVQLRDRRDVQCSVQHDGGSGARSVEAQQVDCIERHWMTTGNEGVGATRQTVQKDRPGAQLTNEMAVRTTAGMNQGTATRHRDQTCRQPVQEGTRIAPRFSLSAVRR